MLGTFSIGPFELPLNVVAASVTTNEVKWKKTQTESEEVSVNLGTKHLSVGVAAQLLNDAASPVAGGGLC